MEELFMEDLGLIQYNKALEIQTEHFNELITEKQEFGKTKSPMKLIVCQHEPVFTLGKNGDENNLLKLAEDKGAQLIRTNRGGDITFHGPGQLVVYPILDLEKLGLGLAKYIENLEEVIINVIEKYNLKGNRINSASGVWLDVGLKGKERKICALGIRSSRWITMHGLAFNINTDLTWFNFINPCGILDKGVTSLSKELNQTMNFQQIKQEFIQSFIDVFQFELKHFKEEV